MSGPLQILHFADTPRRGGAEGILMHNVAAQVAAGHDVEVLTAQRWLAGEVAETIPGARATVVGDEGFHGSDGVRRRLRVLAQVPSLARALRARRPDVLHVNNGGYPGSDLGRLIVMAARAARVPRIVMTVHAVPQPRAAEPAGAAQIDAVVWRCVDVTIGATRAVQEALVGDRSMPPQRFRLVPYGVADPGGDPAVAAALRAQLGVPPGGLLAGMLSAASDEQKGHHVLVTAAGQACADVRVAIAGAAPPPAAGAEGAERVQLVGRVDDVGTFLAACDVLVVPSVRDESLPLVVLEAMAAGRPVIASRLSGIPEAVQDGTTGRLLPPGDVAALARTLTELAEGDRAVLSTWGAAGRARWEERFSLDAMTAGTLAVYGD
ncbi:MAG: glycosyl transferase group 1 [Conexibacter sp.]|nr:glycosyl transferase group 1 [Conexibacter sp.]